MSEHQEMYCFFVVVMENCMADFVRVVKYGVPKCKEERSSVVTAKKCAVGDYCYCVLVRSAEY